MGGDAGLGEAIRAAGLVTELARRIGISQPSVFNWSRVPADRVVAVEAATGVARAVLRPGTTDAVDDTAVARAQEYALLAALLARPPDAALLKRLAKLESDGTPLGVAHRALAGAAAETDAAAVAREYFDLFIGVGRGELLPYGSYYLAGFLHERPLARLRADLVDLGVERVEGQCEPEDHAAILCEIMAGGLQACRGRPEELAPHRRPQPVAKTDPGCEVRRRDRGHRHFCRASSRRLILQAVTKIRR